MIAITSGREGKPAPEGFARGVRHVVAANSGHWIHLDEPELVVDAVRELIEHEFRQIPR